MPEQTDSGTAEALALAREILDDLESSRVPLSAAILKSRRLAKLRGNSRIHGWLTREIIGYLKGDEFSAGMMRTTGRWINEAKGEAYWSPISEIEADIAMLKMELENLVVPQATGDKVMFALKKICDERGKLHQQIKRLNAILCRVAGWLHEFVEGTYAELVFSSVAEGIFDQFRSAVDSLIGGQGTDEQDRFPIAYDRIVQGDSESISHALSTCRRIICAFADSLTPDDLDAERETGEEADVGRGKTKNRLTAFVKKHVSSDSRRTRLRHTLTDLFEKLSAGVHNEVSADEARALLLSTYLYLGELAALRSAAGS